MNCEHCGSDMETVYDRETGALIWLFCYTCCKQFADNEHEIDYDKIVKRLDRDECAHL